MRAELDAPDLLLEQVNTTNQKAVGDRYEYFKQSLRLPADLIEWVYSDEGPFRSTLSWFYTDEERAKF